MGIGDFFSKVGNSITGAAGDIVGGLIGSAGQYFANDRQMDYDRFMSNTAVQRRKKDLIAAGFNPMLAIGDPASSPQAHLGNVGEGAGRGVAQGMGMTAKAMNAQIGLTTASANAANTEAEYKKWLMDGQGGLLNAQIKQTLAQAGLSKQQTENAAETLNLIWSQIALTEQQRQVGIVQQRLMQLNLDQGLALMPFLVEIQRKNATLSENERKANEGIMGEIAAYIRLVTGATSQGVNSAGTVRDMFRE